MNKVSVVGLDLAKNVFQVHGCNKLGEVAFNKKLSRAQVSRFFARLEPCLVGMEACGGAHYWHRVLTSFGHTVKIMPAVYVKPYVKTNKNDRNDAEAICEAVQRPNMRFVEAKSPEQQAVLHLHHSRRLLVRQRVAITNHMRGLLLEYGITLRAGDAAISRQLPEILEDADNGLPMLTRHMLNSLALQFEALAQQIAFMEKQLQVWHKQNEMSQRLAEMPGIGLMTASALVGKVGNASAFRNGRQLSASLGLVPRQSSSGGKDRLLGISKRGDAYVRGLLIHGARSVIRHIKQRLKNGEPGGNPWVEQLLQRCHVNEVTVALANKMARIAWVILARGERYRTVVEAA